MRKIFVIAKREYQAAVRTKAFIVTLVLMPVLMLGSVAVQALFKKLEDTKEKHYAVIDRTPGQVLTPALKAAVQHHNKVESFEDGRQVGPQFALEFQAPNGETPEAMAEQRYQISQRIEKGELEGLLEIGPDVIRLRPDGEGEEKAPDSAAIRFQAKNPAQRGFHYWAERAVNAGVLQQRFKDRGIDIQEVARLQQPVPLKAKSLTRRNPQTGAIEDAADEQQFVNMFLPAVLIALMFMVIMVGATPAMQGIVEEKSQRIAEVLLGSATPFELMAGKLLGVIGVSLTMAAVYLGGGYALAANAGLSGVLSPWLIFWFVLNLILALLIFGSIFIAVGAAATDVKETQTLLMPIMLIACLPFFALSAIMQDPNGSIATAFSFIPFATPMLLVARESVPPGVPIWQMVAGIAVVLVTTWLCVWAAGRIFRVGILMTGKGASFRQMMRWVVKG
jgi:ABC-2 type transport system permease protein